MIGRQDWGEGGGGVEEYIGTEGVCMKTEEYKEYEDIKEDQ